MCDWFSQSLTNRKVREKDKKAFEQVEDPERVPQGGVLSPTLFLILPTWIYSATCADNLVIRYTEKYEATVTVSRQKTLQSTKEQTVHLQKTLSQDKTPTYLGIT